MIGETHPAIILLPGHFESRYNLGARRNTAVLRQYHNVLRMPGDERFCLSGLWHESEKPMAPPCRWR